MFDPALLSTFVTVAKAASFSEAGRRLGLRQSTVSQHIRRLEEAAGRRLFVRDTHSVTLTADGQAMVALAHGILEANQRARQYFAVSELRGRLRFGAAEDFVRSRLPEVLRDFTRIHRAVDLELRVDLSGTLFQALEGGELDLVLAKRRPGDDRGRLARRERLIWIAADSAPADFERPLPLILYPPASTSRAVALEALEHAGRSWRIVCTSGSLSGLNAAALAGLGYVSSPTALCRLGFRNCRDRRDCRSSATSNLSSPGAGAPCAARRMRWRRPFSTMPIGCKVPPAANPMAAMLAPRSGGRAG